MMLPPNQRLQRRAGSAGFWLVSAVQVVQVLNGWRVVARR